MSGQLHLSAAERLQQRSFISSLRSYGLSSQVLLNIFLSLEFSTPNQRSSLNILKHQSSIYTDASFTSTTQRFKNLSLQKNRNEYIFDPYRQKYLSQFSQVLLLNSICKIIVQLHENLFLSIIFSL